MKPGPDDADEWVRYLARTSYLLQQGEPVADLLVLSARSCPTRGPPDVDGDLTQRQGIRLRPHRTRKCC